VPAELLVVMNPRGKRRKSNPDGGIKMSDNVQAICYRHTDDDENYCHGFGNADVTLKTRQDGTLILGGMKDDTDVAMYAMPDGSICIKSNSGKRLWDDFDVTGER